MKYTISNNMWCYEVSTNLSGLILFTNCYPNNRPLWVVGRNIEELREYYYRNEKHETEIDKLTHVHIKQIN